jgi:membrane protein
MAGADSSEQPRSNEDRAPEGPSDLKREAWGGVLKRTIAAFRKNNLTVWAAALTYYGVLSIFG